jgi:hypothetical protein
VWPTLRRKGPVGQRREAVEHGSYADLCAGLVSHWWTHVLTTPCSYLLAKPFQRGPACVQAGCHIWRRWSFAACC